MVSAPVDGQVRLPSGDKVPYRKSYGGANWKADNDPLIVVDGFPISGYMFESDPFSSINPNDVESVTVLKDGRRLPFTGRAANGVIVITTKRGKSKAGWIFRQMLIGR
ncbi:MAG: TonB-dependent receptor plug domain-containing protein [Butyricimonas faecalis]